MFKTTLFAALAAATLVAAPASFAAETSPRSVTINAADLNLASPQGVATLDSRIAHAVKLVCGPVDTQTPRMVIAYRECREAALTAAKPRAEAAVAAYLNGKAVASSAVTVSR
jgi:UrcA family protein